MVQLLNLKMEKRVVLASPKLHRGLSSPRVQITHPIPSGM